VGWALASTFLPRFADIYGRKPVFMFSILLQFVSMGATYFSNSAEITIGIMFFLGFSGVGRCSICFLYLMELLPADKQTLVGTILQMNNGLVAIWMALYFWIISRNWYWIETFAMGMSLAVLAGTSFLPESPKFLMSK
jgi:MFS family permease